MIKVIQMFLNLFSKHKDKLPDNMDSIGEIQDLVKKHGDKLDDITDKIPGDADDKLVEKVKKGL